MDWATVGIGFIGGAVATFFKSTIDDWSFKAKNPIRAEHELLLRIAKTARGRLYFRQDIGVMGPPILHLARSVTNFQDYPHVVDPGQMDRLVQRGLLYYDKGESAYVLSPQGWAWAGKLKPFSVEKTAKG